MAARGLVPLVSGVALQQMLINRIESLPQTDNQRYQKMVISHLFASSGGLGQNRNGSYGDSHPRVIG